MLHLQYVPLPVDYLTKLSAKINGISGGIDGRPWVFFFQACHRLLRQDNDEYKGKGEGEGCDELEEKYENQNNEPMKAKKELEMMKMENECNSKECEKALKL
ncbi:hypothetical protein L2E82_19319 [Cichorium intybus]|uniref:Uncharacterized protein n=1 Tax=Cichorium intybus TaxID=13427 RepID=A0ACB9FCH5_CICIN|nr:hypothetical protein L2E82_19319 [Cichorium intybus]